MVLIIQDIQVIPILMGVMGLIMALAANIQVGMDQVHIIDQGI
jgi:hypothetical protein